MKMTRKVLAMVLCLMLVFSLATTAFAAGHSHTITIINQNAGYTYGAYQIFDGVLGSDGVLSDIAWGEGVDGTHLLAELQTLPAYSSCTDAKQVAAVLAGCSAMDDPVAIAFADIAAKYVTTPSATSSFDSGSGHYTISGLDDGYYLVINTAIPDAEDTTYSRHIMEVVRDITVTHKGDFPKVEKKIIEPELELDANEAAIGEAETYEITGTMPGNIQYYATYKYIFHDTLSKGLTFNNDVKVTVNGVEIPAAGYYTVTTAATTATGVYAGGTDITIAFENLKAVEAIAGTITHETQVIVAYSATVNTNAVVASTGNPNKVYLEYDNNPNSTGAGPEPVDPTGKTPVDEVKTYVTELTILKKDGAGNVLTGAEFELKGTAVKILVVTNREFVVATGTEVATHWALTDGTFTDVAPVFDDPNTTDVNEDTSHAYVRVEGAVPTTPTHILKEQKEVQEQEDDVTVKAFVGDDGYVTFTGLGAGTYTLTETTTPDGFNTIEPITFTVTFDPETGLFNEVGNNLIMVETDNTLYAEIINVAGTVLPSTGGIGTTLFYVIGGLMFAGAAILLVTKKRMSA